MKETLLALVLTLSTALAAAAQTNHSDYPQTTMDGSLAGVRALYETVRGYLVAAAEQMPEDRYGFKPTPDVRSFGQIIGHVANSGHTFCAAVLGEHPPQVPDAEKLTSKAELVSALEASLGYCDRAYHIHVADVLREHDFFGQQHTGLSVLALNMGHDFEHYGNLVTYMRMNGMVPPSSQPRMR